jgi:hypothetical protein
VLGEPLEYCKDWRSRSMQEFGGLPARIAAYQQSSRNAYRRVRASSRLGLTGPERATTLQPEGHAVC